MRKEYICANLTKLIYPSEAVSYRVLSPKKVRTELGASKDFKTLDDAIAYWLDLKSKYGFGRAKKDEDKEVIRNYLKATYEQKMRTNNIAHA
jgi:hypothetical protein